MSSMSASCSPAGGRQSLTPDAGTHMNSRGTALRWAWPAAAALNLLLGLHSYSPPLPLQAGVELVGCTLVGLAHAHLTRTREDWLSSPCWPAALLMVVPLARTADGVLGVLSMLAGGLVASAVVIRVLEQRFSSRSPHVLAALMLGVLALPSRFFVMSQLGVSQVHNRLADQLALAWTPTVRGTSSQEGPPIVLITVDALRWDDGSTMSSYQRLAERGRSWPRAMAGASWTIPSVGTLMTGLLPEEHGAGRIPHGYTTLDPDVSTIAQRLSETGWTTAAIVTNPFLGRALEFDRGFQVWWHPDELPAQPQLLTGVLGSPHRDANRVVDHAITWLDRAPDTGFFLWVHLFEPHVPYDNLPPDSELGSVPSREALIDLPVAQRPLARAAYREEVAHADRAIHRLLNALEERGILDEGVVILTADHGEEFWEHGEVEHGHSHHGEVVDVPLVVVAPGLSPGPQPSVASLLDVSHTIYAIAGLTPGPRGHDLRKPLPVNRIAVAAGNLYGADQRSAKDLLQRVILTEKQDGPHLEAYDQLTDPWEQEPRAATPQSPVAARAAEVRSVAQMHQRGAADLNTEQLEALGYLE